MKKIIVIWMIFLGLFIIHQKIIAQVANHLVIAEIYGGGGNSGATYQNDYVILFNPTASEISVSSFSLQYAPAASGFSDKVELTGSILSNNYYGILLHSGGDDGEALPFTANASNTSLNIANTGGKIALVSNLELISGISDPDVIDFVGYGNASVYEGNSAAHSLSNTTSIRRKDDSGGNTYGLNGNGYDSDNNGSDFYVESDLSNNPPLPVELISFNFMVNKNDIILKWKTATEINNFGFDIERNSALQEEAWEKIGFVKGNGTSNSPKEYSYVDKFLKNKKYQYRLKQIDNDGSYKYSNNIEAVIERPLSFSIKNFPNPFNPETKITFELPFKSLVNLKVYNLIGQEVATLVNEELEKGIYERNFNAGSLPSGTYLYCLNAGGKTISGKMLLMK